MTTDMCFTSKRWRSCKLGKIKGISSFWLLIKIRRSPLWRASRRRRMGLNFLRWTILRLRFSERRRILLGSRSLNFFRMITLLKFPRATVLMRTSICPTTNSYRLFARTLLLTFLKTIKFIPALPRLLETSSEGPRTDFTSKARWQALRISMLRRSGSTWSYPNRTSRIWMHVGLSSWRQILMRQDCFQSISSWLRQRKGISSSMSCFWPTS